MMMFDFSQKNHSPQEKAKRDSMMMMLQIKSLIKEREAKYHFLRTPRSVRKRERRFFSW